MGERDSADKHDCTVNLRGSDLLDFRDYLCFANYHDLGVVPFSLSRSPAHAGWPDRTWRSRRRWSPSLADNNGAGTLRTALSTAAAGDTISFAPGLTGTITLTSPLPIISQNQTITGARRRDHHLGRRLISRLFRRSGHHQHQQLDDCRGERDGRRRRQREHRRRRRRRPGSGGGIFVNTGRKRHAFRCSVCEQSGGFSGNGGATAGINQFGLSPPFLAPRRAAPAAADSAERRRRARSFQGPGNFCAGIGSAAAAAVSMVSGQRRLEVSMPAAAAAGQATGGDRRLTIPM